MIENLGKINALIVVTSSTMQSKYINRIEIINTIKHINKNPINPKTVIDFHFAYNFSIINQVMKHACFTPSSLMKLFS